MKKSIIAVLAVSAISTLGSSAAFAHEDYSEGGALHWLEHVQARASSPTERELATYGYASNATPSRTVIVNADTRYINVTRLETVALKVGDKTVNWTFDTLGTNSFPLSKVVQGPSLTVPRHISAPPPATARVSGRRGAKNLDTRVVDFSPLIPLPCCACT